MSKEMIILASVGTNILRAKMASYDKIKAQLEEHTGLEVLNVFTDDHTAEAVSTAEERVYTVEEAVEKCIRHKADMIYVVPVFMTKGELYRELALRLDFYRDRVNIKMADAVLSDEDACRKIEAVMADIYKFDEKSFYLVVDHGNPFYHCASNTYLQQAFDEQGYKNVKVIQLSEKDSFGQAVAYLKANKADETNSRVVLLPLIVAWGDYMADALYNAQNSLMWNLRDAGFRTVFTGEGLGEHERFRKIYNERFDELKA